eukprot:2460045-Rhodomonas_salina.2
MAAAHSSSSITGDPSKSRFSTVHVSASVEPLIQTASPTPSPSASNKSAGSTRVSSPPVTSSSIIPCAEQPSREAASVIPPDVTFMRRVAGPSAVATFSAGVYCTHTPLVTSCTPPLHSGSYRHSTRKMPSIRLQLLSAEFQKELSGHSGRVEHSAPVTYPWLSSQSKSCSFASPSEYCKASVP